MADNTQRFQLRSLDNNQQFGTSVTEQQHELNELQKRIAQERQLISANEKRLIKWEAELKAREQELKTRETAVGKPSAAARKSFRETDKFQESEVVHKVEKPIKSYRLPDSKLVGLVLKRGRPKVTKVVDIPARLVGRPKANAQPQVTTIKPSYLNVRNNVTATSNRSSKLSGDAVAQKGRVTKSTGRPRGNQLATASQKVS